MNRILISVFSIVSFSLLIFGMYILATSTDPAIAAAAITASTTIVVSTTTIAFGRYYEKRKELEALHRANKIPFYGKFLEGLFGIFYNQQGKKINLVKFLQEWQQQIVIWGGPKVINAYIDWKNVLATNEPNVKTLESTEKLVLAIREELGHIDKNQIDGIFPEFILRKSKLYFELAKKNPNLTLSELSEQEGKLQPKV